MNTETATHATAPALAELRHIAAAIDPAPGSRDAVCSRQDRRRTDGDLMLLTGHDRAGRPLPLGSQHRAMIVPDLVEGVSITTFHAACPMKARSGRAD